MGKCLPRDLCKSFSFEIQKTQKHDFNRNKIESENLIAIKSQDITHEKMINDLKQKVRITTYRNVMEEESDLEMQK